MSSTESIVPAPPLCHVVHRPTAPVHSNPALRGSLRGDGDVSICSGGGNAPVSRAARIRAGGRVKNRAPPGLFPALRGQRHLFTLSRRAERRPEPRGLPIGPSSHPRSRGGGAGAANPGEAGRTDRPAPRHGRNHRGARRLDSHLVPAGPPRAGTGRDGRTK